MKLTDYIKKYVGAKTKDCPHDIVEINEELIVRLGFTYDNLVEAVNRLENIGFLKDCSTASDWTSRRVRVYRDFCIHFYY